MKRKTKIYLFLLAPLSVYKVRQMFANRDYNDCRQKKMCWLDLTVGQPWIITSLTQDKLKLTVYLMNKFSF